MAALGDGRRQRLSRQEEIHEEPHRIGDVELPIVVGVGSSLTGDRTDVVPEEVREDTAVTDL